MKKYDKYKDSRIEWIGKIPEHWEHLRMDGFADYVKTNITNEEFEDEQVLHYSIPNIQDYGKAILEAGNTIKSNKLLLSGDEVLVSKLNPRKKTIIVSQKVNEKRLIASSEFIPLKAKNEFSTNFLYYLFLSENVTDYLNASVESATKSHQRTSPSNIYRMWFACPKAKEQTAIANFLDRKTTEIDNLITKKEKLLKLYDEEKTAIINQTVTKGIPRKDGQPSVSYKDSGVEWLGEIPEHWEVKKIKHLSKLQGGYAFKSNLFSDSGIPIIRIGNIKNPIDWNRCKKVSEHLEIPKEFILKNSDTLIALSGATTGKTAFISNEPEFSYINQRVAKVGFANKLLYFNISGDYVQKLILLTADGSAQENISNSQIENINIAMPPDNEEQTQIAKYIETEISRIDKKITKTEKLIKLLKEYKTALISEVVTGRVKVI